MSSDTPLTDAVWADMRQNILEHACTLERRVAALESQLAEARKDSERLDWLEKCRERLNADCGSSYGWEVIRSHLVTRLMFRTPENAMAGVDVNDTGPSRNDIRAAIDAAMNP